MKRAVMSEPKLANAPWLWSALDMVLRQSLQFCITVILARLLTPDEFGTVALLAMFTGLAAVLVDGGLSAVLIQRQSASPTDETTVFWFNLVMGIVLAAMLWAAGPGIATFYAKPVLASVAAAFAVNVLLGSLGAIHTTLLTKHLNFQPQMRAALIATVCSAPAAVLLALQGFGIWALAAQALVGTAVNTVCLWRVSRWRPSGGFSTTSAQSLFRQARYLLASSLLEILYSRLYTMLLGTRYGTRELGIYERADSTVHMPLGALTSIITRVTLPVYSSYAGNIAALKASVERSVRIAMLINAPLMMGLAAVAEPFVALVFGRQWLAAAPALQVLCLAGLLWPLHAINLQALIAQGRTDFFFRLEIVKKVLGILLLSVGAFFGLMGIAWSQVLFSVLAFGVNAHYSRVYLKYSAWQQLRDAGPAILIATVMAVCIYALRAADIDHGSSGLLALQIVTGAAIYAALAWLPTRKAWMDMKAIAHR